jgi:anti-anti-sigma factor
MVARADYPPPFTCSWRMGHFGSIWVDLAGELDLATSPQLATMLGDTQSHSSLVVLDLRALNFMDSAGAHVIIDAGISARKASRGLLVVRGPIQVDMVFALTGASNEVELFDLDPELCPPAYGYDPPGQLPVREPPRRGWRGRVPSQSGETPVRNGTAKTTNLRTVF